jgi:uncharacterized glyoxalase superfamily protein PhnB
MAEDGLSSRVKVRTRPSATRLRSRPLDLRQREACLGEGGLIVADVGHGRVAPNGETASQSVMLRVDDVSSLCERVRSNGGVIVREPEDFPYGERQCTILDPGGHRWTLTETLRDVAPEDWGGVTIAPR